MKVSEAMTRDVRIANPGETIRQAARTMAEIDAGVLPVQENDRLVGTTTLVQPDPGWLFDIQAKRIHEYKRQLLNDERQWLYDERQGAARQREPDTDHRKAVQRNVPDGLYAG